MGSRAMACPRPDRAHASLAGIHALLATGREGNSQSSGGLGQSPVTQFYAHHPHAHKPVDYPVVARDRDRYTGLLQPLSVLFALIAERVILGSDDQCWGQPGQI